MEYFVEALSLVLVHDSVLSTFVGVQDGSHSFRNKDNPTDDAQVKLEVVLCSYLRATWSIIIPLKALDKNYRIIQDLLFEKVCWKFYIIKSSLYMGLLLFCFLQTLFPSTTTNR